MMDGISIEKFWQALGSPRPARSAGERQIEETSAGKVNILGLALSVLVGFSGMPAEAAVRQSYEPLFLHVADIPLGDATSRFDYQSLDGAAHRLYIAKMGSGKLVVFDLTQAKLASELDGFPKITGVLAVPALHKIYASVPGAGFRASISVALGIAGLSSGRGGVTIVDSTDLHEIARLPGGVFPDGVAYDPKEEEIFVSDELGGAVLVINAATDRLVGRIEAGGEVGNVQYDPLTGKIYAPVQSGNELIVIDPAKLEIVNRHPLDTGKHPHGLAIAPHSAIGYVACDGDDRLLTVDLASGKLLSGLPVGPDPDVLAIDAAASRLYVASESGMLSSFDIANAHAPRFLGDTFVGSNAHSVAVDPATHQLYLPLPDINGHAVMRVLMPRF